MVDLSIGSELNISDTLKRIAISPVLAYNRSDG